MLVWRGDHDAGLQHSFRAIGITAYLEHPEARVEVAQYLAGHAKTETPKLYERREGLRCLARSYCGCFSRCRTSPSI